VRGTDEGQSSVRGEWGRGELVGRERTRNSLPCGASGAGGSWLGVDGFSFSFYFFHLLYVARVGGLASGRVAGAERLGASSFDFQTLVFNLGPV